MLDAVVGGDSRDLWVQRVLGITVGAEKGKGGTVGGDKDPSAKDPSDKGGGDKSGGSVSLVTVSRAALSWRALCDKARSDVASIKADALTALETSGLYDEDDLADARDELTRFNALDSLLSSTISDLIDDAINAQADARKATLQRVLAEIAKVESDLAASEEIADLENNNLRALDLSGPARTALASLRQTVGAIVSG